ncbi:hypothetical protein SAZ11_37140 [Streptomyces sp. FXJ1.4098]|nr:hypothetical protein [Streptomyces sp. FXJ1.4098]
MTIRQDTVGAGDPAAHRRRWASRSTVPWAQGCRSWLVQKPTLRPVGVPVAPEPSRSQLPDQWCTACARSGSASRGPHSSAAAGLSLGYRVSAARTAGEQPSGALSTARVRKKGPVASSGPGLVWAPTNCRCTCAQNGWPGRDAMNALQTMRRIPPRRLTGSWVWASGSRPRTSSFPAKSPVIGRRHSKSMST